MNKSFVYMQAILQSGSFSRAASELGISQPSLSQFIQRLEKDVGATLLDRQSRPLKLTAEGACWMEAETNVNRIREIYANRIREMSGRHSRHLRVGTLHYFEGFVFPKVLPKVLETLPDLDVQLTEDNAENLKKGLLEDRLDLAVLHCESCGQELTGELLFKERCLLAFRADDPLVASGQAADASVAFDFSSLDRHSFVALRKGQKLREVYDRLCGETGAAPCIRVESNDPAAALALTLAGHGPTLVTDTMARLYNDRIPVRFTEILPQPEPIQVCAVHKTGGFHSNAARALIEVLQNLRPTA